MFVRKSKYLDKELEARVWEEKYQNAIRFGAEIFNNLARISAEVIEITRQEMILNWEYSN